MDEDGDPIVEDDLPEHLGDQIAEIEEIRSKLLEEYPHVYLANKEYFEHLTVE